MYLQISEKALQKNSRSCLMGNLRYPGKNSSFLTTAKTYKN